MINIQIEFPVAYTVCLLQYTYQINLSFAWSAIKASFID